MKIEVTIDKLRTRGRPGQWRLHAKGTFADMQEAGRWAEKHGPKMGEPEAAIGWAIRIAFLP